jgi:hypothetical protein
VRERSRRQKKRTPSATGDQVKERIQLPLCFRKNRNLGCQDGTRSVRLRSTFHQRGWFPRFPCVKPNKISASISIRWERIQFLRTTGEDGRPPGNTRHTRYSAIETFKVLTVWARDYTIQLSRRKPRFVRVLARRPSSLSGPVVRPTGIGSQAVQRTS